MSQNIFRYAIKGVMILAVLTLGNCKNQSEKSAENNLTGKSNTVISIDSIVDVIYSMPDPDEILNEIFTEELEFNSDIIYPIEKANMVFESNSVAVIMGVLMADMTYLILQEKTSLAIEYFKTVVRMSDQLDLRVFRNKEIFNKIEANIDNKEALLTIFKGSISEIKYELDYSKRNKVLALIYTGSIIETLYIAVNTIDNNNTQAVSNNIMEQYTILKSLHAFLSYYSSNTDIQDIIAQLDSIKYYMNNSIIHDSISIVQKSEIKLLQINGGVRAKYDKESFDSVRNKISAMRNTILGD